MLDPPAERLGDGGVPARVLQHPAPTLIFPSVTQRGYHRTVTTEARYEVNKPEVVDESVDGEALIVHLGTGAYFSARGPADVAWQLFAGGATVTEVVSALAGTSVDAEAVAGVAGFLSELVTEDLLRARLSPPGSAAVSWHAPFAVPTLEKFTDMEDLLLLDPIHDVDDATGWPNARTSPSPAGD